MDCFFDKNCSVLFREFIVGEGYVNILIIFTKFILFCLQKGESFVKLLWEVIIYCSLDAVEHDFQTPNSRIIRKRVSVDGEMRYQLLGE